MFLNTVEKFEVVMGGPLKDEFDFSSHPLVEVTDTMDVEITIQGNKLTLAASDARVLLLRLLGIFDPDLDSLNLILHRNGMQISNLASVMPSLKSDYKLPDSGGGFYVSRSEENQWFFGYPVNDSIIGLKAPYVTFVTSVSRSMM
jgi:hypothetical protein